MVFNAETQSRRVRVTAAQAGLAIRSEPSRANASAESFLGLPAAGVRELKGGGSNWESTTLAPAYAARPKASVDIPSWRLETAVSDKNQ